MAKEINVFIAPGSQEHINKSVISTEVGETPRLASIQGLIPIENIRDTLNETERKKLEEIYPDKRVRMWGARSGLKARWNWVKEGDIVVFYSNNYYICTAEAVYKTENKKLAEKVWGVYRTGETWDYITFIKNVRKLNMNRKDFNKIAGYSENFIPQGFMRVRNKQARDKIIENIILKQDGEISLPPEAEKFIENFKKDPEIPIWLEKKIKVFDKWRTSFSKENIEKLSRGQFQLFLSFKGNQSWDGIQRQPSVYEDMDKLRKTIKYLVDGINDLKLEGIKKKLDDVLDPDGSYKIKGLDKAVVTGIMHICDTKNRLGVWNSKVDRAFKKLNLFISKPSKSRSEKYLAINHILNLIGKKYDLNLYQVDVLMHKIAIEYEAGEVKTLPTFSFVSKDFNSSTGKKDDARYLNERFKTLLSVLKENLGPDLREFTKGYVARTFNQGSKKYRKHMWLGLAHDKLKWRPQECIQLQVSVNPDDPFSIEIFVDRVGRIAKRGAKSNIEKNMVSFLKQINSLEGYFIGYLNGKPFEVETSKMTEEGLKEFLKHMEKTKNHVYISKRMTKKETVDKGTLIVDEIIKSWKQLLPVYTIMTFGKFEKPIITMLPLDLKPSLIKTELMIAEDIPDQVCANLNSGHHIIITGPVGTGKTTLTEDICRVAMENNFCDGHILTTATSDWTTFDTIGGYMPTEKGKLNFEEGKFLEAIRDNKWLIIDEINRADIDKAFGQLFTVLSGQKVELPFKHINGKTVSIERTTENRSYFDEETSTYRVGNNWRIMATMNVYDMNFLFEMSYAFMRRFKFIYLDVPKKFEELIDDWCGGKKISKKTGDKLKQLTKLGGRKMGPAIIKDMINYLGIRGDGEKELAEAMVHNILSQLEGLKEDKIRETWNKIGQTFENKDFPTIIIKPIFEEMAGIELEEITE